MCAQFYDFESAIFEEFGSEIQLMPIKTEEYLTPVKGSPFTVLDKSKIKNILELEIPIGERV